MPKKRNRLAKLKSRMPDIRDSHGTRRLVALLFGFYSHCGNDLCRRAQKCVGAGATCFHTFWPATPELEKDWFRELVKARTAGARTVQEIKLRALEGMLLRYGSAEALTAEINAVLKKPLVTSAPKERPQPPLPRARIL